MRLERAQLLVMQALSHHIFVRWRTFVCWIEGYVLCVFGRIYRRYFDKQKNAAPSWVRRFLILSDSRVPTAPRTRRVDSARGRARHDWLCTLASLRRS